MSIYDLPEYKPLQDAMRRHSMKVELSVAPVRKFVLNARPDRSMHFFNEFAPELDAELNALHQALWDAGQRASLRVTRAEREFVWS